MNQELEEKLYNKYPKLFKERSLPMTQTCMCWGLECGSGWFDIIDRMCSLVQHHIDETRRSAATVKRYNRAITQAVNGSDRNLLFYYEKRLGYKKEQAQEYVKRDLERGKQLRELFREVPTQLVFTQIKEKMGTLTVYYSGGDDYCRGAVSMAESMSSRICEDCGNPGKIRPGGWIRTLCDVCDLERKPKK
jgi:hypothetical protein